MIFIFLLPLLKPSLLVHFMLPSDCKTHVLVLSGYLFGHFDVKLFGLQSQPFLDFLHPLEVCFSTDLHRILEQILTLAQCFLHFTFMLHEEHLLWLFKLNFTLNLLNSRYLCFITVWKIYDIWLSEKQFQILDRLRIIIFVNILVVQKKRFSDLVSKIVLQWRRITRNP